MNPSQESRVGSGWEVRPLGKEAAQLEAGLRSSPYIDAKFLTELAERDPLDRLRGREAWTAWQGDKALGFVILDPGPGGVTELTLAVLPESRRRGVGRCLVEFALERGRKESWATLSLFVQKANQGGRAFFESVGFSDGVTQLREYDCLRRDLRP